MKYHNNINLCPIAVLTRPLVDWRSGPFIHYMLLTASGWIFHNTPKYGEHFAHLDVARQGLSTKVQWIPRHRQRAIQERLVATALNFQPYHATLNNCQHTITRILTSTPSSPTLQGMIIAVACGVVICKKR